MKEMNIKWRASTENMRKLSLGNESSVGSWRSQDSKELSTRPPIYNPEDYATSLKKWALKASQKLPDQHDINTPSPIGESEMSLRQFLSVSDLLNKLKTDLRLAYSSFVQEFVSDPIDGVTLLLELLRSIQQKDPQKQGKVAPTTHRRTLLEENSCLQCLQYCLRCEETTRRLTVSSVGLYTVAVCIMSSVSKSRIISLELLSKVCTYSTSSGHNVVSEAMSTMRLRFGEPVRFRFLVSMLNGATPDLLLAGLRFLNAFLETSPSKQIQLYIQAELEQAGFNSDTFKKILTARDGPDESVLDEFNRWSRLFIDVEVLKNNYNNKCKEVSGLKEKISQLEAQVRILQAEKDTLSSQETQFKDRYTDLDYHISVSRKNSIDQVYTLNGHVSPTKCDRGGGGNSTPAEDEGISSSDQDDSEEIVSANSTRFYVNDSKGANEVDQLNGYSSSYQDKHAAEPTIDEVMEDFQNIINDVQNQNLRNEQKTLSRQGHHLSNVRSSDESLSEALILENETDIVPSLILPEPPRKSRSLHLLSKNIETNPFFEDESLDNCNLSYVSRCNNFHISSERFASAPDYRYDRLRTAEVRLPGGSGGGLRRSETFHQLQNDRVTNLHPPTMATTDSRLVTSKARKFQNEKIKLLNARNKNYIIQNTNNFQKEIRNKEEGVKLSRSVSTKPAIMMNGMKPIKCAPGTATFSKINPIAYFSKANVFPGMTAGSQAPSFTLKRHQNAGLYSDKNHATVPASNGHLHQVITITSEYPKRSLNGLRQLNLNICDGKIMDLPSGLY